MCVYCHFHKPVVPCNLDEIVHSFTFTVLPVLFVLFSVCQAIELTFHRKTLLISEHVHHILQRIGFQIINSISIAKVKTCFYVVSGTMPFLK